MNNSNKNYLNIKAIMIAALLYFAPTGSAFCQTTPVLPSNADTFLFASGNPIIGLNTSMVGGGSGYLFAMAYYDGSGTESFTIDDPGYPGGARKVAIPSTGHIGSVPGVALGTSNIAATNHDTLAVAYIDRSLFFNQIDIEFYDIYDDGVSTFSVNPTPVSTYTFSVTSGATTVHINAIADYNRQIVGKFAITWDDGSNDVWVQEGDFYAGGLIGSAVQINSSGPNGSTPDVAGIQRNLGSNVSPAIDDIALVTYLDAGAQSLYFQEYNFNTTNLSTYITLDNVSGSSTISLPRIDAIDNYGSNATNSKANYEVVAQVYNSGTGYDEVREYDSTNVSSFWVPSDNVYIGAVSGYTSYTGPYYNEMAPTISVASDGGGGFNYSMQHYTGYDPTTLKHDILFMEPYGYASTGTLVNSNYYWVNGSIIANPQNINGHACNYANATCSAPNDYTQPTLYIWAYNIGFSYEIDYKTSVCSSSTYSFRQSQQSPAAYSILQVYPNPATDELMVQNTGGANAATQYRIIDMAGRELLQGSLQSNMTTIAVGGLAPGTYVISMTGEGLRHEKLFVKN